MFAHGTVGAITMFVLGHTLGASLARDLLPGWKLSDGRLAMVRVTVILTIFVRVRPFVIDPALAIDTLFRVDVEITIVTGTPLLAALLTHGSHGGVVACRALSAVVFTFILVNVEEAILWAKFTLTGALLTVTQVARVALSQPVGVTATHGDGLDFS